jgi:hypothetical protein
MSLSLLELLQDKGFTVSSISKRFNVSQRAVYYSINSHPTGSRRIRLFISSVVGRPPSLLFPDLPQNVKIVDDFQFMNSLSKQ